MPNKAPGDKMTTESAAPSRVRTILFRLVGTTLGVLSIGMALFAATIHGTEKWRFIATGLMMGPFFIWGVWRRPK
jgi:hypothetical protein